MTILDDYTPHTPRPIYKDYLKEENNEKRVRHSIDLGSIKYP